MSESLEALAVKQGAVLRSTNLLYTLMHDSWRNGREQFRNRLMVRVERDNSVSDEEYEALMVCLAEAIKNVRFCRCGGGFEVHCPIHDEAAPKEQ